MDVPAQGAAGIPVQKTEFNNNEFKISVPAAQINFSGELLAACVEIQFFLHPQWLIEAIFPLLHIWRSPDGQQPSLCTLYP